MHAGARLRKALELGAHYLEEETPIRCQGLWVVGAGIGYVGEADGGIRGTRCVGFIESEGGRREEELEGAVVGHGYGF